MQLEKNCMIKKSEFFLMNTQCACECLRAKSHYKKKRREKWEQEGEQRAGNLTRLPYESKKACGIF